jgi:serine/threonine protein kinase
MPLSAGTKLGPYKIEAPLGAGGMGEVYRARDTRLDRTVAIKVLSAHLSQNEDAKRRFDREARAISSLNHPNICTLHDIGHQDGTDFLVMEYLEGETLGDRLARGPLAPEQVLRYGIEICDGLEKAHKSGVIHRDLKPGNIMLTKSGAKLMDFGLAKATSDVGKFPARQDFGSEETTLFATPPPGLPLTVQGTVLGTVQYMAPEQLEGKEADERSDIFALGTVLYEMASGRPAFTGQSHASIVAAILTYQPPSITMSQPVSPSALDSLIKTCMAKDPDDRWQTVHDVKLQLRWISEAASRPQMPVPAPASQPVPMPAPAPAPAPPPAVVAKKGGSEIVAWLVAAIALLAALALAAVFVFHVPLPFGSPRQDQASNVAGQSAGGASTGNAATSSPAPTPSTAPSASSAAAPNPADEAVNVSKSNSPAPANKPSPVVDTTPLSELKPHVSTPAVNPPAPATPQPAVVATAPSPKPGAAQLLQDGKTELADQNAQAARESFRKAADAGNAQAAVLLGTLYAQGLGGPKSDWDAVRMFRQAAETGNARGMFNLGLMYESGRVVGDGKDPKSAAHWYTEASKRGDGDAAYRLGMMYEEGRGVEKDLKEAGRLYSKSQSADAKLRLARLSQDPQ